MARFKSQLKALGLSFDWDREINTTDPEYYKVDAVDLHPAVQKRAWLTRRRTTVNYCTGCKVVLANEEVVNGVCERCGSPVSRRTRASGC